MSADLRFCLIGQGLSASPSPAMHEAALAAVGRSGGYDLLDVVPGQLPAVLRQLRRGRWQGANVTIPYKRALAAMCEELVGDATITGVVNTLSVTDNGALVGDNTDATGFELGLSAQRLWPLPGTDALVVGAGGAAAAVVLALSRVPMRRITVVARRINMARAMVEALGDVGSQVALGLWDEDYLARVLAQAAIVVNTTPAGVADMPFSIDALPASCTVADVRYRPRPVDVVAAAIASGRRACDGTEMLLHQGMLSFQRWTGEDPPVAAARTALYAALDQ